MLFNKINLEVSKFASKAKFQKAISNVLFTKDKVVATDAFRLVEITTPKGFDIENYPNPKNADFSIEKFENSELLIPADDVSRLRVRKSKSLPILNNAVVIKSKDIYSLYSRDLEKEELVQFTPNDGKFPSYESIFPEEEPVAEIAINGKYLADILSTLSKLNYTNEVRIRVFKKPTQPIVILAEGKNQKGRALLMPIAKHD